MAIPAIPAAKAAIAILTDEKARGKVAVVVGSFIAALFVPIFLLIALLTLPFGGLFGTMGADEYDALAAMRGQYGLDQYVSDADYNAGGIDYSGIVFADGQASVSYYSQLDSRWKDVVYGDGTIGRSGCGPTSLAMVVSGLLGEDIDPVTVATWAYENGYKAVGNGSYHSLIPDGAAHFGLTCEGATAAEAQKVIDALAAGKPVIAIMSAGHFTKGGHFIVLRGVTAEGKILVADPASTTRSAQEWDPEIVFGEARKDAGAGGPLWIISN